MTALSALLNNSKPTVPNDGEESLGQTVATADSVQHQKNAMHKTKKGGKKSESSSQDNMELSSLLEKFGESGASWVEEDDGTLDSRERDQHAVSNSSLGRSKRGGRRKGGKQPNSDDDFERAVHTRTLEFESED